MSDPSEMEPAEGSRETADEQGAEPGADTKGDVANEEDADGDE